MIACSPGNRGDKRMSFRKLALFAFGLILFFCAASSWAQSGGSIEGVVKDPSGAIMPNATVEISNAVSGYHRETTTGINGDFRFTNLPFNPYHLVVTTKGFSSFVQVVSVRSTVPNPLDIILKLGAAS